MNSLKKALNDYLKIRRKMGFKLLIDELFLNNFLTFLESKNAKYITVELALQWATLPKNVQPNQWAKRLSFIRTFAKFQHAVDSHNEIPPNGLLAFHYKRQTPYIYSSKEIVSLLKVAKKLKEKNGLRASTYYVLFGLLAVTGMRISEVIKLDDNDVNLLEGLILIREGKFGKTRLIPIHQSVTKELKEYKKTRDKIFPHPVSPSFFIGELGKRLTDSAVRGSFVICSRLIGMRTPAPSHGYGPRIHDFRHTFAVNTLLRWYKEGKDVEVELPKLCTYLGHVDLKSTYWYLTAIPELMQYAVEKINR